MMEVLITIKNKHLLNLFLLMLLAACDTGDYVKGNGVSVTLEKELPSFNAIDIQGNYEIKLLKNEKSGLKIIADENIIPHISAEIENNVLKIYNKERIKSSKNIKIYINYWDIHAIHCGGASSIKSDTPILAENLALSMTGTGLMDLKVEAETLDLDLSGTGLINLSGQVESEELNISGAGKLNASNLISNDCNIELSGIGSADIHVENHLNAQISGIGGIKYKGKPKSVNREVVGLGTIDEEID